MKVTARVYGKLAVCLDSFGAVFRENQATCQFAILFSEENEDMKTRRIWFHIVAIALLWLFGGVMTAPGSASAQDDRMTSQGAASAQDDCEDGDHFRGRQSIHTIDWDFVKAIPGTLTAERGGTATAFAEDGSKIILTGTGTVHLPSGRVTGGGTWQTLDAAGATTGAGWYRVRSFISFDIAPGIHPPSPPFGDAVGNFDDTRAGLLQMNVDYLDGTRGVLAVSCHLSENQVPKTPGSVFEGAHATKGFSDYYKHSKSTLEDSNTLLHIQFRR
jgi:hypothetical protein